MSKNTKYEIKIALYNLLKTKSLKDITVKDITEECGLNRNSFYYHYEDIPSLATYLIEERAKKIANKYGGVKDPMEMIKSVIKDTTLEKRIILNIVNSQSRVNMERILFQICRNVIERMIDENLEGRTIDEDLREAIALFFRNEMFGIVIGWINDGLPSELEKADTVKELLDGHSLASMIDKAVEMTEERRK